MLEPASLSEESEAIFVESTDAEAVSAAVEELARADGLVPVDPRDLPPLTDIPRATDGPHRRRVLVGASDGGWTPLLLSVSDVELTWTAGLAERMGRRCVRLGLVDGDVFTCHVYRGDDQDPLLAWISSPVHFDIDEEADLAAGAEGLAAALDRALAPGEAATTLAPPGAIDIDGRLAFVRTHGLLGLPDLPAFRYRLALGPDGLMPAEAFHAWRHAGFEEGRNDRETEEEAGLAALSPPPLAAHSAPLPEGVIPFRPRR